MTKEEKVSKSVLIVEDNKIQQEILSIFLKKVFPDLSPYFAESAEEAEEIMAQKHFEILLLDINLPGINGLHFLKKLRKRYAKEDLLIVMISGMAQEAMFQRAKEEGADDFLKKPINLQRLQEIILAQYPQELSIP